MRLILLEDEAKVRGFLLDGFEREGFTTLSFSAVPELKDYLLSGEPSVDIAVLDRMVRERDGASLIPVFKEKHPGTRILILSALNDAEERAKILDQGADDYLGKPYSFNELLSRLRALFRRPAAEARAGESAHLQLGNLEMHLLDHQARVQGKLLDLTPKEFRLLSILAREPAKVWSKFRLLDLVWQINLELESNVVESTIRNIRRKLELSGANVKIQSRRNVGYWVET